MSSKYLILIALPAAVVAFSAYYLENAAFLEQPAPSFLGIGPPARPHQPAPAVGDFAHNEALHRAKRLFKGQVHGSESVAVAEDGALYMLDKFGTVFRSKDGQSLERLAFLGPGRPLGFHFDKAGNLLICNAGSGLQMLEKDTGTLVLLATEAPDATGKITPIRYANDLTIAQDGSIYFSDSTVIPPAINPKGFYDTMASFILAYFQGGRTGRVLKYDPSTKTTSLVASGLYYSNGVALGPDDSYLLVVETCTAKVVRYWLKGPKSGTSDVFWSGGPGYPDGVTNGSNGTYWVSLVTLNSPLLQSWMNYRFLRWLGPRLPASLKKPTLGTGIVQLSGEGKLLRYLDDSIGAHINTISAVTETATGLYLGNLGGDFVSFLSNADLPAFV